MSDTTADLILPVLQSIQTQIGELRGQIGELRGQIGDLREQMGELGAQMDEFRAEFEEFRGHVQVRLDTLDGRLAAFAEMTSARFTTIENTLVDLSARTHVLSSRVGKLEA